jgi:hypothetical protein
MADMLCRLSGGTMRPGRGEYVTPTFETGNFPYAR